MNQANPPRLTKTRLASLYQLFAKSSMVHFSDSWHNKDLTLNRREEVVSICGHYLISLISTAKTNSMGHFFFFLLIFKNHLL